MTTHPTLPVWDTVTESWRDFHSRLGRIPAVGLFPALLFLALVRLEDRLDLDGWVALALGLPFLALHAVPATLLVVPWYRASLAQPGQASQGPTPAWYYLNLFPRWLLLEMIIFVPLMPVEALAIALDIAHDGSDPRNAAILQLSVMAIAIAAWPYARCSLALPAAAIGADSRFAESWRLTTGNGWRIVGTLLLCLFPIAVAAVAVRSQFPTEPSAEQTILLAVLGAVYYVLAELLSATVLSRVYFRLSGATGGTAIAPD